MKRAISNTSPILFLYRIDAIHLLPQLFEHTWITQASIDELHIAKAKGYDTPVTENYPWLKLNNAVQTPSEWLSLDLGKGELAAMALGLENPDHVLLLDDAPARRIAKAAGLEVWGTLKILLEAKKHGVIESVKTYVDNLERSGMWLSQDIRIRILYLANEYPA